MTGQALIRAAEMRSILSDMTRFATANHAFRDKYQGIAGDFKNATKFWGTAAAGAACYTTASTDAKTCDGNGNGQISDSPTQYYESYRYWQQLANAGLIEGTYSGTDGASNMIATPGVNVPAGKVNTVGYNVWYRGTITGSTDMFNGSYGNWMRIGGTLSNNDVIKPVFTPAEVWTIDTKIDDGKPAYGKMTAPPKGSVDATNGDCSTNTPANASIAAYNLSGTATSCFLNYDFGF